MKNVIIALIIIAAIVPGHGQDLNLVKYEDTQNIKAAELIGNGTDTKEYLCKDGSMLRLGDKLIIGRPSTNANEFTTLFFGRMSVGSVLFTGADRLEGRFQAEECVITRIAVNHLKASRRSPLYVLIYLKNTNAPDLGSYRSIVDFEKAIILDEIINPKARITRDEAISKLKESKDLLDLGIITQTKYDSLKAVLTPIITQK